MCVSNTWFRYSVGSGWLCPEQDCAISELQKPLQCIGKRKKEDLLQKELVSWFRHPFCAGTGRQSLSGRGLALIYRTLWNVLLFVPTELLLIGCAPGVFFRLVKLIKPNNNLFGKLLKERNESVNYSLDKVWHGATNVFVVDDYGNWEGSKEGAQVFA